jgi:hypothetical protein
MFLEIATLRKSFVAKIASKGLFASMPSSMQSQRCLVRELSIAVCARIALFLAVNIGMIVEIGTSLESCPANVTHKGPVIRMDKKVTLKQLLVLEFFLANVAIKCPLRVSHLL